MPPDRGAHTAAVAAVLAALTIDGDPVPVHLVDVPGDTAFPYLVVTPSPGGFLDGPLGSPNDDGELVVLVTAVDQLWPDGQGARRCGDLQTDAQQALLTPGALTVEGWKVRRVRLDVPGGVALDRDPNPHRFFAVDRYVIATTPDP